MQRQGQIGGLGSSHTVPFGTAVPARPPTRSWHVTRALCMAQWFCGASVQGTRVVVQDGHFRLASICGEAAILFSISNIHGHIQFAGWPKTGGYYLRPESKPRWLANQIGGVPTNVSGESQQQHEPPEDEDAAHPSFVLREAKLFWQQPRARAKQDVQAREFRDGSEPGMHSRQRKVRPTELGRNPRKHL